MTTTLESPELVPAGFFVPDLIQLEVGRGSRVLVVSDLHLTPVASEVSTKAADELAELLSGFGEPGILVIAGDGFEMLAAAPDVDGILPGLPPPVHRRGPALRFRSRSPRGADPWKP